jgi:hypothetical protein
MEFPLLQQPEQSLSQFHLSKSNHIVDQLFMFHEWQMEVKVAANSKMQNAI